MFGQTEVTGGDVAALKDLSVAACGPGIRAVAVVKNRVRLVASLSVGCPVSVMTMPLPPGGKVLALSTDGPTAVTADGSYWYWAGQR